MGLDWMLEEYDGIVYVSDLETCELKYMNRTGCRLFGIQQERLAQEHRLCYEVLQGRDSPCPFCTNRYLEESGFYEWERYNPVLGRTLLLKDRKFVWEGRESRIEFALDVTKYRDKITQKERERDSVLKSLPGGIARLDARDARTVLWYGANFLPMIGYTKEQFERELHSECRYVHPDDLDTITQIMTALQQTGKTAITEMRIVTRSGDIRTLTTTFSYEDGASSEDGIPSFYSIGIDITERKEEQERQRKALADAYEAARMANQAKTDFLSSMSHDIRTPMNAILGMTAIAGANIADRERVQDCLNKIDISSRHLLGLINEVLDMSKIESGRIDLSEHDFSLAELVQNVMDVCRPLLIERRHHFKADTGGIVHENVYGDMERLQQVLINILSNAVKYTPAGGSITVSIREKALNVSHTALFEFVFTDNGIGMSESFVQHIFEPFSRAEDSRINKIQGTGLGMAISENMIHMMNGRIQVDSVLGKGSRFVVEVPLQLQEDTRQAVETLADLPVLVVDDDADVCANICVLLENIGMRGSWVQSGQEAVREVCRANACNDSYFAVMIDWKMPDMDGLETAKGIRARLGAEILLILVSAYDSYQIGQDFMEAGLNAFLAKPLFQSNLLRVFQQLAREEENGAAQETPKDIDFTGRRLLLVEDNDLNREIAQELLEMVGALVDTAQNGEEAVKRFAGAPVFYYDAVLMDIQMPVMNGYEAATAIRAQNRADARSVAILALTANAFSEDIAAAKNAGMDEHIVKPINPDELYAIIKKWMPVHG